MKNTIKERLASCPCLKSRRSAFLTGAAVAAGGLLVCRLRRRQHKRQRSTD
mgnify:FL=1